MLLEYRNGDGEGLTHLELTEWITLSASAFSGFDWNAFDLKKLRHIFAYQIPLYYPKG